MSAKGGEESPLREALIGLVLLALWARHTTPLASCERSSETPPAVP